MGKKIGFYAFNVAVLALCASAATAATVTVNSASPEVVGSNYKTISAALNYVKTTTEPREVNIVGGGPYEEAVYANFSVKIQGLGYRPVIALKKAPTTLPASIQNYGLSFYTTTEFTGNQNFEVNNLILIPSLTSIPTNGIRSNNNAAGLTLDNMTVTVKNVLITANNGSNAPLTSTGLDSVSITAPAVTFVDDGMTIAGYTDLNVENTIITHIKSAANQASDGIVFSPDVSGKTFNMGGGCVISDMNRVGIQIAGVQPTVNLIGTKANPIIFKNIKHGTTANNGAVSIFSGQTSDAQIGLTMDNVIFLENNAYGLLGAVATTKLMNINVSNCAFVGNKLPAIANTSAVAAGRTWKFENCTVVNNGIGGGASTGQTIEISNGASVKSDGSFIFKDCIIAGNGTTTNGSGSNLIDIKAELASVSFVNSAIVTEGPYALDVAKFRLAVGPPAAPIPTQPNVINADPQFVAVGSNFASADFLDVANGAYVQASSTNGPLKGYGDYVGPNASVTDWSTY